ncbi:SixA phosphatase family protein [Pseudooceanicola aestuarii]|uniref:SixA phosphatase family protein n=1 Tax=Pseudooceanicola aestuarii TaxID=2697319 RepID=UPI0013D1DD21|nr:histidine phosphatase family protein [Pseudooceanicola aestuarii]
MRRRLILMRHAKSSWATAGQEDHARPLNGRGRRSAEAIGKWLFDREYLPDVILCSTAARTVETLERLKISGRVELLETLYHAPAGIILDQLRLADRENVLILGHNPGAADFAARILRDAPPHGRFADFPTCATLVVDFEVSEWAEVQFGTGTVRNFITPRELLQE